jgi:ribonuclease M5
MLKINEAVIVEGKYDKIRLSSVIDATIIETDGFSIFGDKEKLALIKRLAEIKGILIITDSDLAGFKIRNYLCSAIPSHFIKHAYIPDIFGKEKRKALPSKEGKLGVEGIPKDILLKALENAGVLTSQNGSKERQMITKAHLFEDGLSGTPNSNTLRLKLLEYLNLPKRLTSKKLVEVLNIIMTYEEYKKVIKDIT